MDILKTIIYQQNLEFLTKIANDMYIEGNEKIKFIQKYHKKNFAIINIEQKDKTSLYQKRIKKCVQ